MRAVFSILLHLLTRFALMGLVGLGTYYAILLDGLLLLRLSVSWPAPFEAGPLLSFISAGLAGVLALSGFGHPGARGWAIAGATALAATALGAALAGTLVMPGRGTLIALDQVMTPVLTRPLVLLIWAAMMAGLHVLQRRSSLREA